MCTKRCHNLIGTVRVADRRTSISIEVFKYPTSTKSSKAYGHDRIRYAVAHVVIGSISSVA